MAEAIAHVCKTISNLLQRDEGQGLILLLTKSLYDAYLQSRAIKTDNDKRHALIDEHNVKCSHSNVTTVAINTTGRKAARSSKYLQTGTVRYFE